MTLEERNKWIQYFQCQQAKQLVDLNKSIGNGICAKKAVLKNNVLSSMIDVLYRYKFPEETVTLSYTFNFPNTFTSQTADATITIGSTQYQSNQATSIDETMSVLKNKLAVDFNIEQAPRQLMISSFDPTYTPSTKVEISSKSMVVSAENTIDETLDEMNCLTTDEICNIIKFMKRYVKTKCKC